MAPTSYQGPMQVDEQQKRTYSQTAEGSLGGDQPGRSVAAILADKGQDVFTIGPEATVLEAVSELNRRRIGVLVVVAGGGKPAGILSERDVVRHIEASGVELFERTVKEVMTVDPVTCSPDDSVEHVMTEMTRSRFRHMPVMQNDRLCGLVSIGDIVNHRLVELEYENLKIKQAMVG